MEEKYATKKLPTQELIIWRMQREGFSNQKEREVGNFGNLYQPRRNHQRTLNNKAR